MSITSRRATRGSLPPDLLGEMSRTHGKVCQSGWTSNYQVHSCPSGPRIYQSANRADEVPLGGAKSPGSCRLCLRQKICCKSNFSDLSTKQTKRWSWKDQTLSAGAHKEEAHLEFRGEKVQGRRENGF